MLKPETLFKKRLVRVSVYKNRQFPRGIRRGVWTRFKTGGGLRVFARVLGGW